MYKFFAVCLAFLLHTHILIAQYNCQQTKRSVGVLSSTPPINNNFKSDSLDILHYHIALDLTAVQSYQLRGSCAINISPLIAGVTRVNLDLAALTVDSIHLNNSLLSTFTYTGGPQLAVTLPNAFAVADTFSLTIFYHGTPITDQSGWGGFHFSSPYFYNLGVGFAANPHTFGRAWFPCFDNFVEKSTFGFAIKTAGGRKAYCNGLRTAIDTVSFGGDTVVSYWQLTDPIPSYLASVAVSNYEEKTFVHNGKPFHMYGRAADTANVSGSFANITAIYDALVSHYGPYKWQKVGYALTTIGAMEHATSIHYPRAQVNGNLQFEDIIAHELAHHWFGNLITCETAGDMWFNEGFAEYVSHQYQETMYGRERYEKIVLENHAFVIQYAAVADDGHYALYNLPNELTYGEHTYQKGAMVAHNLRTYMGDSLFFNGLKTLFNSYAFKTINSYQFRDHLGPLTGLDLTDFCNDWIFNPGYPEFNIDSMRVVPSVLPESIVKVGVSHRTRATSKRFSNVPLRITLHDSLGYIQHHEVIFSGNDTVYTLLNATPPQWGNLNENAYLLDGTTFTNFNLKQTGFYNNNVCKMDLAVTGLTDSMKLRVEHHWTGPSRTGNEPFRLSNSRYWRVTGHVTAGFKAEGRLEYSNAAATGNLDADLVSVTEDSLILVYRKDATEPWREYDWYSRNYLGSPNNGYGRITIQVLIPGEFAFANGVSAFGVDERPAKETRLLAYPNPTTNSIVFSFYPLAQTSPWLITAMNGKTMANGTLQTNDEKLTVPVNSWPAGNYIFTLTGDSVVFTVR